MSAVLDITIRGQVHRIYFTTKREAENFITAIGEIVSVQDRTSWSSIDLREASAPTMEP